MAHTTKIKMWKKSVTPRGLKTLDNMAKTKLDGTNKKS